MAKIKTTNQEFPIPAAWVALEDDSQEAKIQRDTRLRRLLSGYIPAITNAQLTYAQEGEETIVRVTPQLGTKGREAHATDQGVSPLFFTSGLRCSLGNVHQALRDAPAYLPPVLKLAWKLKWAMLTGKLTFERLMAYQPEIREALEERSESGLVERIHQRLKDLRPTPSPAAPIGF